VVPDNTKVALLNMTPGRSIICQMRGNVIGFKRMLEKYDMVLSNAGAMPWLPWLVVCGSDTKVLRATGRRGPSRA